MHESNRYNALLEGRPIKGSEPKASPKTSRLNQAITTATILASIGISCFTKKKKRATDIIRPQRAQLKKAGFVRGRQDFRDHVRSKGKGVVLAGVGKVKSPGFKEMTEKLTPLSCNLSDEETETFKHSVERGFERERKMYNNFYPQDAVGARLSQTTADPDSKIAQIIVASTLTTSFGKLKRFIPGVN